VSRILTRSELQELFPVDGRSEKPIPFGENGLPSHPPR
jgi:hypothetical protein